MYTEEGLRQLIANEQEKIAVHERDYALATDKGERVWCALVIESAHQVINHYEKKLRELAR